MLIVKVTMATGRVVFVTWKSIVMRRLHSVMLLLNLYKASRIILTLQTRKTSNVVPMLQSVFTKSYQPIQKFHTLIN